MPDWNQAIQSFSMAPPLTQTLVQSLGQVSDSPVVVHEEKCTACEVCELICPDLAIDLEVISP